MCDLKPVASQLERYKVTSEHLNKLTIDISTFVLTPYEIKICYYIELSSLDTSNPFM